jgi:hypothetical protein
VPLILEEKKRKKKKENSCTLLKKIYCQRKQKRHKRTSWQTGDYVLLCKGLWTLLTLKMCLLIVSMAHDLLYGIKAGLLNDDEHFPLDVEYVFG